MADCSSEITTEEYVSHFDAEPCVGYPKKLSYKDKEYVLIVKEFDYTAKGSTIPKHFLRVEIWDSAQEKIQLMILLTKSKNCRFHSPINPNFDIGEGIFGTEYGIFLMDEFISVLKKFGYAFLIEEIFPEEVDYNPESKTYNLQMYHAIQEFYGRFGFRVYFNPESGKGYIVLKNEPLSDAEFRCFSQIGSGLVV